MSKERTLFVVKASRSWLSKEWGLPVNNLSKFVYIKCTKFGTFDVNTATVYSADELVERKCKIVSHND